MRLAISMLLLLTSGACVYRGNPEAEVLCEWREESRQTLDLRTDEDRVHLRNDAIGAEDLAIGHADRHKRLNTQTPTEVTGAGRRAACMDRLFADISARHNVPEGTVYEYRLRRNRLADAAVIGTFALLYCLAAYLAAGKLVGRFAADPPIVLLAAGGLISLAAAVAGMFLGEVWSIWFEVQRLGRGHLSYRTNRIPWVQHRDAAFVAGLAAFWLISAARYRLNLPQSPVNRHISTPPVDPHEPPDEPADRSQGAQQLRTAHPFPQT